MCVDVAGVTFPKTGNGHNIPRWHEDIKPLKVSADFWGHIWRSAGKPEGTVVHEIFKSQRRAYHAAIKENKKNDSGLRRQRMAQALSENNTRNLWDEINKWKNKTVKRAPHIDGISDAKGITNLFAEKYQKLYNSVPSDITKISQEVLDNICKDKDEDYEVPLDILENAIRNLKLNKNDGDKVRTVGFVKAF